MKDHEGRERARFLNVPYGAYLHREVPPEDAELTHVGPETPCGEYLRRFWQPVGFSAELGDLPLRIRIMGEDLVLFRDGRGRSGLLQLHCSHRGTSLEFGLVSARGIRCCYHGWLYDVDGQILETPGEPAGSTLKDRLCHGAYPTHQHAGLVFAYLGPPDQRPPFPIYANWEVPGHRLTVGLRTVWPCNWLQVKDNSMDPVHTAFLHTIVSGAHFSEEHGVLPELEWQETDRGMMYIATRRVGDHVWVRIAELFLPNVHQFPPDWEHAREERVHPVPQWTNWSVPIDDRTMMKIGFVHVQEEDQEAHDIPRASFRDTGEYVGIVFGETGDRPYEERQRQPGDYDAAVSQRPIAVHALEHLGATDRGVIMFRKLLRREIRAVHAGQKPCGPSPKEGETIPTYCRNAVLRLPPAPTPEADRQLLRDTGRRVAATHAMGPSR